MNSTRTMTPTRHLTFRPLLALLMAAFACGSATAQTPETAQQQTRELVAARLPDLPLGFRAEQRAVGSGNAVPRHNCNGASGVRAGWSWVPVYAAQQQPNTLHFTLHRTAHAANG
ncbi:MAG: hypothetical protein UZ07_CHB004000734 [Chlorobi bacterium OLB7]|nr:MAG: hypothetical protein UZ07_CHB004000734 [Chlorobi bacterium OLB7]